LTGDEEPVKCHLTAPEAAKRTVMVPFFHVV